MYYNIIITSLLRHYYIIITSLFPLAKTGNNELIITNNELIITNNELIISIYYALSMFSLLHCYYPLLPLLPIIKCYQRGNLQISIIPCLPHWSAMTWVLVVSSRKLRFVHIWHCTFRPETLLVPFCLWSLPWETVTQPFNDLPHSGLAFQCLTGNSLLISSWAFFLQVIFTATYVTLCYFFSKLV